jgi:hypothetical protein
MSVMGERHLDIQEAIGKGELTFQQIAVLFGVTVRDVETINAEMLEQLDDIDGFRLSDFFDDSDLNNHDYFEEY